MDIQHSIEHLFRHEYGKVVSALTNKYTSRYIDLIEDSVQEALLKAMKLWSYNPVPDNPSGWLYKVANNYMIDNLRRDSRQTEYGLENDEEIGIKIDESSITSGLEDEQLKMIFACCHPLLSLIEQIMLSLKLLGGLSIKEISSALMKNNEAVKKAITRAKKKFKDEIGMPEVPAANELNKRLDVVLKVIYLIFNEGYKAAEGDNLIKKDICEEAVRLALILVKNKHCNTPKTKALLALMYFNGARFNARIDEEGNLVTLEHQDRKLWDKELIKIGEYYLNMATSGINITEYHLEAGIAAYHTTAESFEKTDWNRILSLYDILLKLNNSSVAVLNRIVVLGKVKGAEEALKQLVKLENSKNILNNYLYHSIKADLMITLGRLGEAKESLHKAVKLTDNNIEKKFLNNKMERFCSQTIN